MEKIKKAYSWFVDTVWPLSGTLSEELIVFLAAFFLSPILENGVIVTWIYIWCAIAIIRIAMYGKTLDENCE